MVGNRLLAALPRSEQKQLLPKLERVPLAIGDILYEPDEPIRHTYFPYQGVVSVLSLLEGRSSIEVGTVGNEGVAGVTIFLGVDSSPNRAVVQVPGEAMKMKASDFKEAVKKDGSKFRELVQLYAYVLLTRLSLSVACNRFHNVEKRLARWLLAIQDRVQSNEILLTQEYISQMLGAHRPHVTKAAGNLQNGGVVRFSRGKIIIVNRRGLEKVSCGCYHTAKNRFDGLFGG
ncbi:MAG TPA: Crp/Fnr family transcriptional regulator [Pyrinomonadaceae bacterium]|nr:Crp/Fnr family transcriptional regulator [Pyrinomonadaceae bacterium]